MDTTPLRAKDRALYHPYDDIGGPDTNTLDDRRTTLKTYADGTTEHSEDSWRDKGTTTTEDTKPWTGRTIFDEKGSYPQTYEHDVTDEARAPKAYTTPKEPTKEERELHNLTHMPYRNWCPICVRAKARTDHHRKIYDKKPLLQADYGFLVDKDTREEIPVLSCLDVTTGMATSSVVQAKGAGDYPMAEL